MTVLCRAYLKSVTTGPGARNFNAFVVKASIAQEGLQFQICQKKDGAAGLGYAEKGAPYFQMLVNLDAAPFSSKMVPTE